MRRSFVLTPGFEKSWAAMNLGDDELRVLQNLLIEDPEAGDVIQGTGGASFPVPTAARCRRRSL